MSNENLYKTKELYNKSFKCIKYEDGADGSLTIYFKNFENEEIDMIWVQDKSEISEIKYFINNI